jgi:hypothetical protein
MTDRYNALIVVLENDMRDDDAASLIEAIKHLRGVADVRGNVSDVESHIAFAKAKNELKTKLWEVLAD